VESPKSRGSKLSLAVLSSLMLLTTFAAAQTYIFNAAKFATGHDHQSVVLADFNKDSINDLAVANYNDNTVSVLLGSGAGNFKAKVDLAVGANPS